MPPAGFGGQEAASLPALLPSSAHQLVVLLRMQRINSAGYPGTSLAGYRLSPLERLSEDPLRTTRSLDTLLPSSLVAIGSFKFFTYVYAHLSVDASHPAQALV
jgi:hypothetical protein